jgi:hypothetical protein
MALDSLSSSRRHSSLTGIAAALLVLAASHTVVAGPSAAAARSSTVESPRTAALATTGTVARRGVWYAIGDAPTVAEVDAAAATYAVVVLNPWETWALRRIKQQAPGVTVLVYKCLSSTRDYHTDALPPAGVGFAEAQEHPGWFATDATGARITWGPYPGHLQMAVWDPAYQARWVSNVVDEVVAAGWDGVLADNDLATLRWYSSAVLAGTTSQDESDALIRQGLDVLVASAGRALSARGKLLVPNISDARLFPGRWRAHAAYGGGMEENFAHWGTDDRTGFLWDWGPTGWVTQTDQLSAGLTLSVTRAAPGDRRTLLYGFASVLVRGEADDSWTPSTTARGDYSEPESLPEMTWDLGAPTAVGLRAPSGVWTRSFARGWAAVNPTTGSVTLAAPRGAVDATGRRVDSVELGPTSGVVLRLKR